MSAATTKEATKAAANPSADLAAVLGAETLPLAEVRRAVDDLTIAKAWAAGLIEFGHRLYCVTGPVGKIGSALVVEDGWDWTGPKTKAHKGYRDILAEKPPKTEKAKKYVEQAPERFGEEPTLKAVEIPAEEALAAVQLYVRLTDKGLGES